MATADPAAAQEAPRAPTGKTDRPSIKPGASRRGTLRLIVKGGWATISVDGKEMGRVPPLHELSLPAGRHKLELLNSRMKSYSTFVTIASGQTLEHVVTMDDANILLESSVSQPTPAEAARPAPPRLPAPRGTSASEGALHLIVKGGWATIYVDGKEVGHVPPKNELILPAGKHRLELINPGLKPYKAVVTVSAGQTVEHEVILAH